MVCSWEQVNRGEKILEAKKKNWRGHPELNQGPLDLQSNALPLSYTPKFMKISTIILFILVTQYTLVYLQFYSRYSFNELAVFLEQVKNFKSFFETNCQLLSPPLERK